MILPQGAIVCVVILVYCHSVQTQDNVGNVPSYFSSIVRDKPKSLELRLSLEPKVDNLTTVVTEPVSSDQLDSTTTLDPEAEFVNSLKYMQVKAQEVLEIVLKQALPLMLKVNSELELSPPCSASVLKLITGLRQFKEWSIQMVDASGKLPEGILHGTLSSFGAYDQCVDIEVDGDMARMRGVDPVRGQYCAAEVRPLLPPKPRRYTMKDAFSNYPEALKLMKDLKLDATLAYFYFMKFRIGICVPSSCNMTDLEGIAGYVSKEVRANVSISWCEKKEPVKFERVQIVAGGILFAVVVLTILGTMVDMTPLFWSWLLEKEVKEEKPRSLAIETFRCFSAYRNLSKLLSTKVTEKTLSSLHGLRFLTMTWVILGHTYYCRNESEMSGMKNANDLGGDLAFQVILNGSFAAQTFFFISGFLVVHLSLKRLQQTDGRFNFYMFYVRRYWRLTPALILISVFVMTGPLNGFGPIWHETVKPFVKGCRNNWWTNLLYIRNLMSTEGSCLPQGWFMACDFQYYIISPVIFLALYRKPKIGKILLGVGVFLSMSIVALITWLKDLPPTGLYSLPDPDTVTEFMDVIAAKPYTHYSAYVIGMASAYLLFENEKLKIKPVFQIIGWAAASVCCLSVVYGTIDWNRGHLPSVGTSVIYAATSRTVWTLGVAWVTLICVTGQGGLVNRFLSWKAFVPLSRLTYMAFLIHPIIMYIYVSYLRNPLFFTQFIVVYMFFAHVLVTFGLALLLSIVFESPFVALEKLVTSRICPNWNIRATDCVKATEVVKDDDVENPSNYWISAGPGSTGSTRSTTTPCDESKTA